ncbi:hypothetical protein DMENIID0001_038640 [Sergentomyia squamirostris]
MPLVAQRASYKGQLTRLKELLKDYESDPSKLREPTAKTVLTTQLKVVQRIEERFTTVQTQIMDACEIDSELAQRDAEQREMLEFLMECASVNERIEGLLVTIDAEVTPSRASTSTSHDANAQPLNQLISLMTKQLEDQAEQRKTEDTRLKEILESQTREFRHVFESTRQESYILNLTNTEGGVNSIVLPSASKLEPLKLPKFSGNYESWQTFHDLFTNIVDRNPMLSNAAKMQYLKTSLGGEALSVIEHIAISDSNYQVAWQRLKLRFDDKLSIAKTLMDRFLDQPKIADVNAANIRRIQTTASSSVNALGASDLTQRDFWLIHITLRKLDPQTQWLWAQEDKDITTVTWEEFHNFLDKRCRTLEHSATVDPPQSKVGGKINPHPAKKAASCLSGANETCLHCKVSCHKLYRCKPFLILPPERKLEVVRTLNICKNCLSESHAISECKYPLCKTCSKAHNKLLHEAFETNVTNASANISTSTIAVDKIVQDPGNGDQSTSSAALMSVGSKGGVKPNVLFATAVVTVLDQQNKKHPCRIVLDPASQVNILSTNMCQLLKLSCSGTNFAIDGVNESTQSCSKETHVRIEYQVNNTLIRQSLNCLVMPRVTSDQPNFKIDASRINIPSHFKLADANWFIRQRIDLLIGGANSWDFLCSEKIDLGEGLPRLQSSVFGWLVVGPCFSIEQPKKVSCTITTLASIDRTMKRFSELDGIPKEDIKLNEQHEAEKSFRATCVRLESGRYQVGLPVNENLQMLTSNRNLAYKQCLSQERRLLKDPVLKKTVNEIFLGWLEEGILERVPFDMIFNESVPIFYMPYHFVIKEGSATTKVRPVFNASCVAESGVSLNDCLHVGPVVQRTLLTILWAFRMHEFALVCDIVKMFLQILVDPEYRDLQRVLLKLDDKVEDFRFTTVCFGMASSPFIATRLLLQIIQEFGHNFPEASQVLQFHTYMDDILISVPSISGLIKVKDDLKSLLGMAKMELAKFQSNSLEVMKTESKDHVEEVSLDEEAKTLGMVWLPKSDEFCFRVSVDKSVITSKTSILSTVARIFDPSGYIAPVVTRAKLIMQLAWEDKRLKWEDKSPEEVCLKWGEFLDDLPTIETLRIPRWITSLRNVVHRELHAFADASKEAYGAAIYLISIDECGNRTSRLKTAKSRLVPLELVQSPPAEGSTEEEKSSKPVKVRKLTIPKAELSGALLAVKLMDSLSKSLNIPDCFYWTDAAVVLYQLHQPKIRQEVFVRNRVSTILSYSKVSQWRHVSTHENPADLVSRGSSSHQLISSDLWWYGPGWLTKSQEHWPPEFNPSQFSSRSVNLAIAEDASSSSLAWKETYDFRFLYDLLLSEFLNKVSEEMTKLVAWWIRNQAFDKIVRIVAWWIRLSTILKSGTRVTRSRAAIRTNFLTISELRVAENRIIEWIQRVEMAEIVSAVKNDTIDTSRKLKFVRKLRPFADATGVIRVGGRIHYSDQPYDIRHPKILPNCQLSYMIVVREHLYMMHAGPQLVLCSLRQRYWLLGGRNLVRKVIRDCLVCRRRKPPKSEQLMGELPPCRVNLVRPFASTGVDFTGSIMLRRFPRGKTLVKAYVAVFVCMSVKAVHLELVSSLETQAFLAALRRFVARRSIPHSIYSDNGTNFTGTDKELKVLLGQQESQEEIRKFANSLSIEWHFNPPGAPNQGGLWESAVRSFKHHFRRTVGHAKLTYEEMSTVLCQIEAVLNSRPLVRLTEDAEDFHALTPGHFLLGMPPTQLPDPALTHLALNRLNRWQLLQRIQQDFAISWKRQYLSTLQSRSKWDKKLKNIKVGDLVLLVEDSGFGVKWPLGVVKEVCRGKDNLVRVASVKTEKGEYKRPITKIVPLYDD